MYAGEVCVSLRLFVLFRLRGVLRRLWSDSFAGTGTGQRRSEGKKRIAVAGDSDMGSLQINIADIM